MQRFFYKRAIGTLRPNPGRPYYLWLPFLLLCCSALAQAPTDTFVLDSLAGPLPDSTDSPFLSESEVRNDSLLAADTLTGPEQEQRPVLTSDTIAIYLLRRVEILARTLNELDQQLQEPLDTAAIHANLRLMDEELLMIRRYYEDYSQQRLDLRSLYAIQDMLSEIEERLNKLKNDVFEYSQHLINYQNTLTQIEQDSTNRLLPSDPVLQDSYLNQLGELSQRYQRVRIRLRSRLLELGIMQQRLTRHSIDIDDLRLRTERQIAGYRRQFLQPNHPPLWNIDDEYVNDFQVILSVSVQTSAEILSYFFRYDWRTRVVNIFFVLLVFSFALFNLRKIRRMPENEAAEILDPVLYFKDYPAIGALAVGLTIAPFFYGSPPLVFVEFVWTILFVLISWLLHRRVSRSTFYLWLCLLVVFVLNSVVMLTLMVSTAERWGLLLINLGAMMLGVLILRSKKLKDWRPLNSLVVNRLIGGLFLGMNALAVAFNLLGIYNSAMILSYAGTFQLIYGVALWIFLELFGELTYLYVQAHKERLEVYSSWLDYQNLQTRLKRILGIFAVLMWVAVFFKGLGVFQIVYDAIFAFLTQTRQIGSFTFSYGGLTVFVLIIYLSLMISRLLAYIFGNHGRIVASDRKNRLGSSMLLVRIGVLAGGFLLALSAAGISLDKVAILLGGLGVGVGLGLQGLFNNLVSGIILAFEKPVKIGDVIELGPFRGRVKEIGLRSSTVVTFDGADVVIPNGDLLSQHLTNWTLSNQTRRIEVIVGVGYGSDVPTTREAILRAIENQEMVMSFPAPDVLVHQFDDSSIKFRVLFWTNQFDEWINIRSNVLSGIYTELQQAGVEIPFPKRDIFVHFPEDGARNGQPNAIIPPLREGIPPSPKNEEE